MWRDTGFSYQSLLVLYSPLFTWLPAGIVLVPACPPIVLVAPALWRLRVGPALPALLGLSASLVVSTPVLGVLAPPVFGLAAARLLTRLLTLLPVVRRRPVAPHALLPSARAVAATTTAHAVVGGLNFSLQKLSEVNAAVQIYTLICK